MFYLVQHIWFCLLLAAAFGAFLMWLVRAWSKEEKAGDIVIGWEARLDALRHENSQITAQLKTAAAKASLLSGLQADFNRQQQQNAEIGSQLETAEKAWMKKYGDIEAGSREKLTSLETQVAKLHAELAALAQERDTLAARLDENSRTGAARASEIEGSKNQVQELSARCAELETQGHEARMRLSELTSECDRLREAAKASAATRKEEDGSGQDLAAAEQEIAKLRADVAAAHESQSESNQARTRLAQLTADNEHLRAELQRAAGRSAADEDQALRQRLAAAEKETANLKSHLSTASYLQDEWRNKWHDVDAKYAAAQRQIAEAASRAGALSGLESENVKLQSELTNWASQYALLRADADLHVSKIKELSDRLAALEPESNDPYDKADNGWRIK